MLTARQDQASNLVGPMLRSALILVQQPSMLALVGYNALTALWRWRNPRRLRGVLGGAVSGLVIPAHDEGHVISGDPRGPGRVLIPGDRVQHSGSRADRCSDDTARVATDAGVSVAERHDGAPGKGAALAWYLDRASTRPG